MFQRPRCPNPQDLNIISQYHITLTCSRHLGIDATSTRPHYFILSQHPPSWLINRVVGEKNKLNNHIIEANTINNAGNYKNFKNKN